MNATEKDTPPDRKIKSKKKGIPCKSPLRFQWDENAPVTLHGYLPFFSDYLRAGGIFQHLVENCPIRFKSNNAPEVADVLGTLIISLLSGHTRYNHSQSLYGDTVAAGLLGIKKIVSHDSLRKAFINVDEDMLKRWLQVELRRCYEPLLSERYILDLDPTVKPLYGEQEGAEIGYNPQKPGRPSHCLHTYFIGKIRLVLDVEVRPGNETAGKYSHEGLWNLLDNSLPEHLHPSLIRGDIAYGNESTISGCEMRGKRYLFKLRQSANVKRLITEISKGCPEWADAGQGWLGCVSELRLHGWSKSRRVVVLRRQVQRAKQKCRNGRFLTNSGDGNECLLFPEIVCEDENIGYEWAVLVTDLDMPVNTIAQLYRDRADCENAFDELKNQWGWGGFTTNDLKRSSMMARAIALVYNWWNIFCRLAEPEKHMEAQTSRPILQNVIGRLASHGGRRLLHLTVIGAQALKVRATYDNISTFIASIMSTAEQLTEEARWAAILARAFIKYLKGKYIQPASEGEQMLLLLSSS
jgi:hypothetical protein